MESETKICQNCKKDFIIEPDDFSFYEKIKVPPPTFCWQCRAMRRMSFRNFRYLYKRKCDATGKIIFTLIPPEAPMPVEEVYFAPSLELLCSTTLRFKSVVIPVYKVLSAHLRI